MSTLREKIFEGIAEDFQTMSKMVIKQINLTRQLYEDNANEELFEELNHNERIIDSLDVKMRDEVINIIVLYTPRASDLRKIMSYYDMTTYLERIGDLLLNISGYLKGIAVQGTIFEKSKKRLSKLLTVTENMTQNAIFAFTCEDSKLAKETIILDDTADTLYHEIIQELKSEYGGKTLEHQEINDILGINSMAYNLERIGDNATNIAEAAIYLMEGKNIKHSNQNETNALHAGSEG